MDTKTPEEIVKQWIVDRVVVLVSMQFHTTGEIDILNAVKQAQTEAVERLTITVTEQEAAHAKNT